MKSYKNLEVYQRSYQIGMQIFRIRKDFPNQEKYKKLDEELDVIGKMLTKLHQNWKNFE